ncbi:hypothetical protein KM043_000193 [Ampulex compressa]|nr:hypothetical protein KM043_000193 [Ampulex compressa]
MERPHLSSVGRPRASKARRGWARMGAKARQPPEEEKRRASAYVRRGSSEDRPDAAAPDAIALAAYPGSADLGERGRKSIAASWLLANSKIWPPTWAATRRRALRYDPLRNARRT